MNFFTEWILYCAVKIFGAFVRLLPVDVALRLGRAMGTAAYYVDYRHRYQVYGNLKIAFAGTKSVAELKHIAHDVFRNFGQNFIELLRLPLMTKEKFSEYVQMEGREYVDEALKQGKGVILLAMHSGSWELANMASAMLGRPYKLMVNPQSKFARLDALLNSYRACGGAVVLERGIGTRDIIRSLQNNEITAMVVDQGGKRGMLMPFFDRQASMAVGAVRLAIKIGTPLCFAVIQRQAGPGPHHRLIVHPPVNVTGTGKEDEDVRAHLAPIVQLMEKHIREKPGEYMWFYKVWKYSREAVIGILDDGRTGHLRQSQAVASHLTELLGERGITATVKTFRIGYACRGSGLWLSAGAVVANQFVFRGRMLLLRWALSPESCDRILSTKIDFVISCGSAMAPVNFLLTREQAAKNITILKPGIFSLKRFDLAILPAHDQMNRRVPDNVIFTRGAPNLINAEYLDENAGLLVRRFSHLKITDRFRIGVLLGGDTKAFVLSEAKMKIVINQIREVAQGINGEILLTTSRRTSSRVEGLLIRELKKDPRCRLLILANRNNVPEAVGGIVGLSDVVVVSGDSISMISEAASSGKPTLVFSVQSRIHLPIDEQKHNRFIDLLNQEGYVLATDARRLRQGIYDIFKNKIQLKKLDDRRAIKSGLAEVV